MPYPSNRDEMELLFADGDDSSYTKSDLESFAREYLRMPSRVRLLRRHELAVLLGDPDRRPTIMAVMDQRDNEAAERRTERRMAIDAGLRSRKGRWRFAAIGRVANGPFVDQVSGFKATSGIVVRDLINDEFLTVGGPTATRMRQCRQLPHFNAGRLPVVDPHHQIELNDPITEAVNEILDSLFERDR
jgi:hypothetical protein